MENYLTNLTLFTNISMYIKTNYIPIMAQGVFQKYVEDIFTFNNDNDDKPEKEYEGVTIEDDNEPPFNEPEEIDIEESEPEDEIHIEEVSSESEPEEFEQEIEPEEISVEEIDDLNGLESEEDVDEKIQKRSPVPSKLSPYKEKKGKKAKKDKHTDDNEIVINAKVSLDRIKLPKRNLNITNENIRTPSGNITMKAYKPNDVLISTLRDIDVQQLRKGDYSIHDLKRFATSLNISTTSKIEDLQQQILDIIENYVV